MALVNPSVLGLTSTCTPTFGNLYSSSHVSENYQHRLIQRVHFELTRVQNCAGCIKCTKCTCDDLTINNQIPHYASLLIAIRSYGQSE